MSRFMRVISGGKWRSDLDWLDAGELSGDVLWDLRTQGGKLSVYRVAEDDRRRVVAALAANRDNVSKLDYAVFEDSCLGSLGITVDRSDGHTPDEAVNGLHYNLGNLTVERLAALAEIIAAGEHKRIYGKTIIKWLNDAASAGNLDVEKVKSGIRKALQR